MPSFTTERRVLHSADEMFALVADIGKYPEFVPLCRNLTVRRRSTDGAKEILVADMTVAYAVVHESFTTRVTLDRPALVIDAQYLEGPFEHLDSRWTFAKEGEGACRVRFAIDYAFRSRLLSALMGAAFDKMFRKFIEAFEARADAVYGKVAAR